LVSTFTFFFSSLKKSKHLLFSSLKMTEVPQRAPVVLTVSLLCIALVAIAWFSGLRPRADRSGVNVNDYDYESGRLPNEARGAFTLDGTLGAETFISLSAFPGSVAPRRLIIPSPASGARSIGHTRSSGGAAARTRVHITVSCDPRRIRPI
jgi:hypothetical protein